MVLKRKKFKNEPTGNTGNRKGYRSRSSESQLRNKRKAYDHRARAAILEAETLMGYYKDLLK